MYKKNELLFLLIHHNIIIQIVLLILRSFFTDRLTQSKNTLVQLRRRWRMAGTRNISIAHRLASSLSLPSPTLYVHSSTADITHRISTLVQEGRV